MGCDDKVNQGQGRTGRGQGRGGRGRGRSQGSSRFSGRGSVPEIKFYPHGSGKQTQTVTYATVKDNIVSHIQRSYRYGMDVDISLRDLTKKDLTSERPVRQISTETDDDARSLEQDGFDMLYQAEIKHFIERKEALEDNLHKAYALIFGSYCSKAIQSRVEDHPDFESRVRDNPIELLKTIRVLMHDTVCLLYTSDAPTIA